MNRTELAEALRNGESSGVEFKRDDIRPERLAAEMAALLNLEGGAILLGVEDDGSVSGLGRNPRKVEEWAMEAARTHVLPPTIPYWETILWEEGKQVGILTLPRDAPDKPYKSKRGANWITQVRVGTTTRAASREEEERLYQQGGSFRYGLKPLPGAELEALDLRRLESYFVRVMGIEPPPIHDLEPWQWPLENLELATQASGRWTATVDGLLLFGREPKRFLPQSGIRAICYAGPEPDYATRADEDLVGPIVPHIDLEDGDMVKRGLVDKAWDFVRRNTAPTARLEGMRRVDGWEYPEAAVREVVANALAHRDYSIIGTDILLAIHSDRLEVASPGRLPNTVTPEGMRLGQRYARNQTIVNLMRDYGYVDARGMGIRNRVIPGMIAHNGTEPELLAEDFRFTVRLWKTARAQ